MAFKLIELAPPERLVTPHLESFWIYNRLKVGAANGELTFQEGWAAVLVSLARRPQLTIPPWTATAYRIEGGQGVGSFTIQNAYPKERRADQLVGEHSWLQLCEFHDASQARSWFDDSRWSAPFTHPLLSTPDTKTDPSRYLFHELTLGNVTDRWAHWVSGRATAVGTEAVSVLMPFSGPTLLGTLLAAAENPRHMPRLTINTFYGHHDRNRPDHTFTHFHGDNTALPGDVEGFVMVMQGAFKAILLGPDLESWHLSADQGWNAERICNRLAAVAARYPAFRRTVETAAESETLSVIMPPPGNRPAEFLFLKGLRSPLSLC
jgi:hypothetical protein